MANVSEHGQWGYHIGLFDFVHARNYYLRSPDGPIRAVTIPITVVEEAD